MKIKLTEEQYKRVILQERVLSDKDGWIKDLVKTVTPPDKEGFKFYTVEEVISKWDEDNPLFGYHEVPQIKNLPFLKNQDLTKIPQSFKDKFPVIVITDYSYNPNNPAMKVMKVENNEYVKKGTLYGAVEISTIASDSLCKNNKKMGNLINACINWEEDLVPVGTYANTSGKNRKDGCKKGKTPAWLFGCGDHPYKSVAYLHPEAAQSFKKMNADYRNMKGKDIKINSAYRDVFHQGGVDSAGKPKAKGGRSNHGFGLSLDINIRNRPWIKKNGGKYGWCWYGNGDRPHFNYFPLLDRVGKNYTCVNSEEAHKQYKG